MSLCQSFQEMARWTWNQLDRSYRLNAPFNEEAITETILLELKDHHPNDIHVVSFSKFQERKIGADWEFWFVDKTGQRGVGWRVQAKRLYRPQERYDALKPNETDPTSQIQTLIHMARQQSLIPVYYFYNSIDDPSKVHAAWQCGSYRPRHELFGCSIALAEDIHNLGAKDFSSIAQISMPWHCAVCCQVFSASNDLPDRVAGFTNQLTSLGSSDISKVEPRPSLPPHVQLLLSGEDRLETPSSELGFEENLFKVSEAEYTGIRGVTVIVDSNIYM